MKPFRSPEPGGIADSSKSQDRLPRDSGSEDEPWWNFDTCKLGKEEQGSDRSVS